MVKFDTMTAQAAANRNRPAGHPDRGSDRPSEKHGDRHADKHAEKVREALFKRVFGALNGQGPHPDMSIINVLRQLHRADHALSTAYDDFFKPYNLTSAKYRLLTWLMACDKVGFSDGLLPSQLSFVQAISPNTVTVLLQGLQEQDLIARARHPIDHRKQIITITEAGRELIQRLLPIYFDYMQSSVAGLTVGERLTLAHLLGKLVDSVEQSQLAHRPLDVSAITSFGSNESRACYGFHEKDTVDDEPID